MPRAVVRVENLRKSYGPIQALNGISFEVAKGTIFGLLGPNGAGKTTTIKILATLARADEGEAEIQGVNVRRDPDGARRLIGYVPQELTVDSYLTADEHLRYYAGLYHLSASVREERLAELLELVGLKGHEMRRVKFFSGGMKKKLDLACGLIHKPEVLLLDEPSLGLDVPVRRDLWSHMLRLKERGVTLLLCTNSMEEAERLCDDIAIIDEGVLAAQGAPAALKGRLQKDLVTLDMGPIDDGQRLNRENLIRALSHLPRVQEIVPDGKQLKLYVESNETALPEILQCAASHSVEIHAVTYSRPGLDEVFLHYTGRAWTESRDRHG